MATRRSDFPNQINNVLAFPGVFRGLLDARSTDITPSMLIAAARALSSLVGDDKVTPPPSPECVPRRRSPPGRPGGPGRGLRLNWCRIASG